jgi:parvulin-like peptidyl-prolyl isomerase
MMKKLVMLAMLLSMCLFAFCNHAPKDGIIDVNGKWITKGDVDKIIDMYRQQMMRVAPQQAMEAVPPEVRKNIAMQLIANELLVQEANKRKIAVDDAKVNSVFDGIKRQFPDTMTMQKEFAAMGQTEKTVRKQIREGIMVDSLMKNIFTTVATVSDEEAQAFFNANPTQFSAGKRFRVSQIMLPIAKNMTPEQKKAVADKANALAAEVAAGKDFASVAKANSQDPSARSGGDIGWFKQGDLHPDFERAVGPLAVNAVSPAVETQAGFVILKKTAEEALKPKTFDEVKVQVKGMLDSQKRNGLARNFVDSLMKAAKIKYADTTYKPLPTPAGAPGVAQ